MLDKEAINTAIRDTIAKTVLEGLDNSTRNAILQESITKALTDYRFTSAINDIVAEKARRVTADLVESRDWSERIKATIEAGFNDYLVNLRAAIPQMLAQGMHGREHKDSYYAQSGQILKCWPKEKP